MFGKLVRRPVAQTAVGPFAIVLISPRCDLRSGVDQIAKPVRIQTFIPQPTVEALHVAVLHRPPWLNVDQLNLPLLAPAQKMRGWSTPARCRSESLPVSSTFDHRF